MRRIRILLIYDIRSRHDRTVETILKNANYEVLRANYPSAVPIALDQFRPDLVITDRLRVRNLSPCLEIVNAHGCPSLNIHHRAAFGFHNFYTTVRKLEKLTPSHDFVELPRKHTDLVDYIETIIFDIRQDVDWLNQIYQADK